MEGKKKSIQLQVSLLQHEQSRFTDSIMKCIRIISAAMQTTDRNQVQQLSEYNAELLQQLTSAADVVEILQEKYSLILEQKPSESQTQATEASAVGHMDSDLPSPSKDGSGAAPRPSASSVPGSGSLHSAGQRVGSTTSASGGSSQWPSPPSKHGHRADKNVALRRLMRQDEAAVDQPLQPPEQPPTETTATDIPLRPIDMQTMHAVTLASKEVLDDGRDLLYLNLKEDEASLDTLCEDLGSLAADERYRLNKPPQPGDLVFTSWDGAWYRARVLLTTPSATGPTVDVFFVDYGNYDVVPLDQCRRLPARLARMPAAAVPCTLRHVVYGPAGPLRDLQALILDALLAPTAAVRAQFHRAAGPAALEADLVVAVEARGTWMQADVVRTVNTALTVDQEAAWDQVESQQLALVEVLQPYSPPGRRAPADRQSMVLNWLSQADAPPTSDEAQTAPDGAATPAASAAAAAAAGAPAADLSADPAAAGEAMSPSKVPQTFIDPPKYRNLSVCWNSKPIYRRPLELCQQKRFRDVTIVNAKNPEQFYICFESNANFEKFRQQMTETYGRLPVHPRQGLHSHLLQPGSFWAARGDDADDWYRVTLLALLQPQAGDGAPEYHVFCVDYGDDMVVSAGQLRPMLEQFAAVPVYVVRAACAGVAPLGSEQTYSEAACEKFLELVDGADIVAHTVTSETNDKCLGVVLYTVQKAEVVAVTELMRREGLVTHWLVQEDINAPRQKAVAPASSLDDSPPSADEASLSSEEGWCLPPADGQLALPRPGAVVYVRVTAVVTPALLYVVLPFGARSAAAVNRDFGGQLARLTEDENLETQAAAMRRYYSCRPGQGAVHAGQWPAVGSLVAVRWEGGWHRGRVEGLEEGVAEVFLVDWGHTEPVPLDELRELVRGFRRLPHQAVACALSAGGRPPCRWPPPAVARLVALAQRGLLLAHVLDVLPPGRLLLDLFHAEPDAGGEGGLWASSLLTEP